MRKGLANVNKGGDRFPVTWHVSAQGGMGAIRLRSAEATDVPGPSVLHQGLGRVAVISDVHANLPALEAALAAINREGVDAIYHLGDAVAIGPFPGEALALLFATPNLHCLMGNHDAWCALGIPESDWQAMEAEEQAHQRWTHAQISPQAKACMAQWPYRIDLDLGGVRVALLHYALAQEQIASSPRGFAPLVYDAQAGDLDALFAGVEAEAVIFGHLHSSLDGQGQRRYLRPGALGCHERPLARYLLLSGHPGRLEVSHRAAPYEDAALFAALESRQVPAREFIRRVFLRRDAAP